MKLRKVDPKSIKVPEERVTARMDDEKQAQFEASIKVLGIDEPIACFEIDGELYLSDGLNRLVAAINNNIPRIDVLVRPGTERDLLFHNLRSGHLRGKHPVSQMRRQIEKAYREYSIGIEDIVKESGLTRDYVENILRISELTPMCLEALDQDKIGVGQAYELTKAKTPDQQEVFLQMSLANNWSLRQLKEFMKLTQEIEEQREQGPAVAEPRPTPTVKCRFCGEEYLPQEVASLIICQVCQGIMFESIAVARREIQKAAAADSATKEVLKE